MKILIIKTSAFGDIVQTFPAIQFLQQNHPECQIDWVVEKRCAALIKSHPLIKNTIVIDTKNWRTLPASIRDLRRSSYDVVFDFQGNIKSGIILGLSKSSCKIGYGSKAVSEWPNLLFSNQKVNPLPDQNIRLDYLALVESFLNRKCEQLKSTLLKLSADEEQALVRLKTKKKLKNWMICPGSQWFNKQLLPEAWISYLNKLDPPQLWLIYGTEQELAICREIQTHFPTSQLCEKMSLPLLQHWMREMDKIFAVDSLLLQLAAEASVPTHSFFGPSLATKYQPLGSLHTSFQGLCPYHQQFNKRCPLLRTCKTGACLHEFS